MQPEPLVKRLPHDPQAIDLSAIHREKQLETWRKSHPETEAQRRIREWRAR
jgi:hypothetical protein